MTQIKFPEHACGLYLEHNAHRDYYQTTAEWIRKDNERECPYEWVNDEQNQKAIETGEIWTLQWYPRTPIGFIALAAADLDVLLEAARSGNYKT